MNSALDGTEVLGLTSEYFGVRRVASGNERIEFAWANTFIYTLVELGLTPVQPKGSLNRPRFPAFCFVPPEIREGRRFSGAPQVHCCAQLAIVTAASDCPTDHCLDGYSRSAGIPRGSPVRTRYGKLPCTDSYSRSTSC